MATPRRRIFFGNKIQIKTSFFVCYDNYSIELNILDKLKMCAGSVLGLVGAGRPCFHRMTVKQVPSTVGEVFIIEFNIVGCSGNFLESDFWTNAPPPGPPPSYQFCTWILNVRHVAAELGPLVCPSRSARPRKCLNLTCGRSARPPSRSARPRKCLNLT